MCSRPPVLDIAHAFDIRSASAIESRTSASSPPSGKRIAPETTPDTLLLHVLLELLGLLSTLLALAPPPEDEDDDQEEKSSKNNEQNLPPGKLVAVSRRLRGIGIDRWD